MVNGTSMDNVHSNFTIQVLKSCGKTANIVSMEEAKRLPGLVSVCPTFSVFLSADSETSPQDPDPGDLQADSGRLAFQPAGPGPAQTNAALL